MNKTPVLALFVLVTAATAFGAASAMADSALYNKGLMALKSGDAQTAINMFSKALEFDPGNYRYYNDRGVAYKKAGNLEKAQADYSRALDIRPDYTNALNNRGVVFLQTGNYDKAIQDFTEALRYGGLESTIRTNLGVAHARKGEHQKAVKEFESAIAQHPTDPRAFLFLAESLEQTGDNERSLRLYQRARTASTDPSVTAGIEKRIAALEKGGGAPAAATASKPAPKPVPGVEENKHIETAESRQSRRIQLARPVPSPVPEPSIQKRGSSPSSPAPQKAQEPRIESLQELVRKSRARAVERFSAASREIYFQGVQFMEQADPGKALIRFEDCSQLEKRNKNPYGVAWNSYELGRVHSRSGDHLKAAGILEEALKYFANNKATDEIILILVELANNRKALGQKERASHYYARAIEESNSRGYSNLTSALQDLALGRAPKPEEHKSAEKPKTDQQPKQDQQTKIASAAPLKTPALSEQRKPAAEQMKPVSKEQPKVSPPDAAEVTQPGQEKASREAPRIQASNSGQDYKKLEMVGKGPFAWGQSQKNQSVVRPQLEGKKAPGESSDRPGGRQPERLTLRLKNPVQPDEKGPSDNAHRGAFPEAKKHASNQKPAAIQSGAGFQKSGDTSTVDEKTRLKSIRQDLLELRKLRQAGHEGNMIAVLERISENYAHNKEYDKALHGLAASLAFREKIGKKDGLDGVLYQSGFMKEKMGDLSGALEDYSRSVVLSLQESKATKKAWLSARAVASRMGLDPEAILDALQRFWRSRASRDNQSETQALYSVAKIYDKAERHQDALNYYDRASASVLTDKARVYERIGKSELAEQSYAQALEAFKKLDYSRYVNMKLNAKQPAATFRN
ncbi:MAG: tetratricopeptide repeat protein [Desulfomonile tiedjei]|uniref:Tetratricopeptide repeat protein n=1 Tax=Desulfomonile tiedjei TaxID=2358 RepID=A0A9D6V2F7_9BACT|nr:tetratricopeptide repeat protein [Desulfomonile tiedjei]